MRVLFAFVSTGCEATFCRSVSKRFGSAVGVLGAVFLAVTPGMFHAGVSYLPQTFSMWALLLSFAAWLDPQPQPQPQLESQPDSSLWSLRRGDAAAVFWMGVASLLGWPFCVLTGVPMALDIAYRHRHGLGRPVRWGVLSVLALIGGWVFPLITLQSRVFQHKCVCVCVLVSCRAFVSLKWR